MLVLSWVLFWYGLYVFIIVWVVTSTRIFWLDGHSAKHFWRKWFIVLMRRHLTLSLSNSATSLCISYWLDLLPVCLRPILPPCLGSILYLSIIEVDFQVNFLKLMMTLCFPHRFPLLFITLAAASTARESFLFLGLVNLDYNWANALGFVELVYLHLNMCWWPWSIRLVNHQARHVRTRLWEVNIYYILLSADLLILHFLDLLKYLIVHLPLSFWFFEFISLLPLVLSGTLVLLLLAWLSPLLLLLCLLLLAVYVNA